MAKQDTDSPQNAVIDMEITVATKPDAKNKKRKLFHLSALCLSHAPKNNEKVEEIGGRNGWLRRIRIDCFRVCMAMASQTLLISTLRRATNLPFHRIPAIAEHILWALSLAALIVLTVAYVAKAIEHTQEAKHDFQDRIAKNYVFAPLISAMMLTMTATHAGDSGATATLIRAWLAALFLATLAAEIKIYGEWFMQGKSNMLCSVANPATHLTVVGNFVAAMAAAKQGWREPAEAALAVGGVHYVVLLVTLYQRHPVNAGLPADMNPLFFLFLAGPSTAALAAHAVSGRFGAACRMCYFLSQFFFLCLLCRINFLWKGSDDKSHSHKWWWWWSSGFPVTMVAVASVEYAEEVEWSLIAKIVAFGVSLASMSAFIGLIIVSVSQSSAQMLSESLCRYDMDCRETKQKKRRLGFGLQRMMLGAAKAEEKGRERKQSYHKIEQSIVRTIDNLYTTNVLR